MRRACGAAPCMPVEQMPLSLEGCLVAMGSPGSEHVHEYVHDNELKNKGTD